MITLQAPTRAQGALRVLCLGAHSDDIEIGCGGALWQMLHADDPRPLELRWVVFSGNATRSAEAARSAEHWLQAAAGRQVDQHDFSDGFFPQQLGAIKARFEALRQDFEPDLIFTHCREDRHQDHRAIHQLTWNTFRNHLVLEYEIPKYDGDLQTPNFYIPLSAQSARSKAAGLMRHFGSQQNKHWFCEELFMGLMRIRGVESCSPSGYAEGFYARKACLRL